MNPALRVLGAYGAMLTACAPLSLFVFETVIMGNDSAASYPRPKQKNLEE